MTKKLKALTNKQLRQVRRAARARKSRLHEPPRPDPFGTSPVVFDSTIPDHFALAAAIEILEKRYGRCQAYFPQAARDELERGAKRLPRLRDALNAPWLLNYLDLSRPEVIVIERMREARFGEEPLEGLGETVAIFIGRKLSTRVGIEDRVARRMAADLKVRHFSALQVLQALHQHCAFGINESWNLYSILLAGTGSRGTRLTSLPNMSKTRLEKYLRNPDESYA
jgi:hypothetical protein